ncbi:trypsin-like cysteine/serine peptidase domain-containing protein [Aspergillus novoparasiticus]|uniref:Trypsin-like cysteine/serine peptidase domain-containing protein n=1 Tax=Aspergillus novoparasiticus TaxID=986946 RepID=A0A5N6F9W6_9EURO|nr:trypsin-like cysteine/serine peptidase domain-containing protein [Aspergillus novoparasiticus]
MRSVLYFCFLALLQWAWASQSAEGIVGGTPASLGEFPHMASLRYGGSHICGASIIAPTKVLTAAHCVYGMNQNNFQIATGTISLSGGQLHKVIRVVIHPQYTGRQQDGWGNDVAVLTLAAPIQYNQYQKPIALATNTPAAGQRVVLSGWGKTSTNGNLANTLLKMEQAVVGLSQCQAYHAGIPLDNSQLCTLNRAGIGACQGDGGGPLMSNGIQVGILSWVLPCAQGGPDVYANVAYLRPFINSQM